MYYIFRFIYNPDRRSKFAVLVVKNRLADTTGFVTIRHFYGACSFDDARNKSLFVPFAFHEMY